MASAFDKRTPVLCYGPRAHVLPGSRRFLLWPAWMFRVLAPRLQPRSLNILQRAVLGLCRAGIQQAESIASRLDLARDLAAHILSELLDQGAISRDGAPTQKGIELLESEAVDARQQVSGYVFQDPWTRDLWPRMVPREEYQEVEYTEAGYPRLLWGTKGQPKRQHAFLVFPDQGLPPSRPRPEDILRACAQHQSASRRGRTLSGPEEFSPELRFSAPHIERTSLIDESPRAVFLVTYLYLPEDPEQGTQWGVCDPFGLGASPSLREAIVQRSRRDPRLAAELSKLLGEAVSETGETLAESLSLLREQAALKVQERLTVAILHSPLYEPLLHMESAWGEVSELEVQGYCPPWKLQGVVVEANKAAEHLFMALRTRHPPNHCWKKLFSDRESNSRLFEQTALKLGFNTPLPHKLTSVKHGKVQWAAEHGNESLRPHLLAALLTALADDSHPLRAAARERPDLLSCLDELATLRDRSAAHANSATLSLQQVSAVVATVYDAVQALRGHTLTTSV